MKAVCSYLAVSAKASVTVAHT